MRMRRDPMNKRMVSVEEMRTWWTVGYFLKHRPIQKVPRWRLRSS